MAQLNHKNNSYNIIKNSCEAFSKNIVIDYKIKESKIDKNLVFEFLDKKEQGKTRTEINNMLIEQINLKQKTIGGKNGL